MRLKLFFFAAAILALASVNHVLLAQQPVSTKKVKEVRILNNKIVSSATIRAKLKSRKGMEFSQEVLNEDLKRLYGLGFFEDIAIDVEEEEDGLIVSFIVSEKPVVEAIEFEGNKAIGEARLKKEISVQEDEILDLAKLSRDLTAIRKLYESKGFQLANIDYKVKKDEELNRAAVKFIISEKQRIRVKSIEFSGNDTIPDKKLKKLIVTKTHFLFFIQPGYFKSEEFEADIERIAAYYRMKGYLDAKVGRELKYSDDGKDMYITINIDEGKQYLVGDIDIKGNELFRRSEIRKKLEMESGDPFSELAMREDALNIQQYYYDSGYMDCSIDSDRLLNAVTGNIDIIYTITENELIYVDKIRVQGNNKTKDVVIRRELRVYPGEAFRGAEIRRSKERLYNLGYFEEVVFDTKPGRAPNKKDLVVTVKETKTGEFSFGGGYSSVDRLVGFVQINQKNFDALDFPTFTGGGQILNVRAELGNVRQNYIASWTDPWIFGYPLLFGFDAFQTEYDRSADIGYLFNDRRRGGDVRLGKEFTEHLRADAMYKLENIDISDVDIASAQSIKDEEGSNLLSRGIFTLKYDTRDNIFTPTRGFVLGGSMENVGGFFGGDKDFVKYGVTANKYLSFFEKKLVLALSSSLNFADSYGGTDKVPIYEKFYAGGSNSIRGYKERYVGPRDSITNDPIGGDARLLASAEATFPLVEKVIKGALFLDAGEVWKEFSNAFNTNLKYGAGFGVRVKTPIGPVNLDYGWPLSDNRGDKRKGRFYFSMSQGF